MGVVFDITGDAGGEHVGEVGHVARDGAAFDAAIAAARRFPAGLLCNALKLSLCR
jgi:hypothetical protein